MLKRFVPILVLLALAIPASAEPPKREAFEIAVDNAMHYLANAQNPDGSWTSGRAFGGGFNGGGREPAITALSVPELVILRRVMKPRLIAVFVAVVATGILLVGYGFNAFIA